MRAVTVIARSVMADAVRRKVIWVVVVFGGLLAFVIPSLPSYGQGVVEAVFREVSLALTFVAAFVTAITLSATRIPAEIERRTVFNVLARDVRRWQYVIGTWVGLLVVVGVVILLVVTIAVLTGLVVYREPMFRLYVGGLAVWLEMAVLMAVAVMSSSRMSVATTIVAVLAFAFVGHTLSGLLFPGTYGLEAWWLPTLETFNIVNPVAHGNGISLLYGVVMIAHAALWSTLLLLLAVTGFRGRDL